ncbi:MAG: ATP-grasp domain-containing protein [Aureliella sp.]
MPSLSTASPNGELNGLAHIMRLAFGGDNLTHVSGQLIDRLAADPQDACALLDLSIVYQLNAQPEMALALQAEALQLQQHYRFRARGRQPQLKLLAIMGRGEVKANTPVEFLVENSNVSLELLYLDEGLPAPAQIPDHDVALVAVCQSDRNERLLHLLGQVMQHWPRPFLNAPAAIAGLARDRVSAALANIDRVVTSDAHRLSRQEVAEVAALAPELFPIIVRPVDSHGGHGLVKLDEPRAAEQFLRSFSEHEFWVAPFIDYRSCDGYYRKARVTVIDGEPFAAHLAISPQWMVHYLNADMLNNQRNRDEEAEFMETFADAFARRHATALQEIDSRLGLDYYSLDCAETQDGRLVLFEVDSGAVVHSMDPVETFPYKAPQMAKIFRAFEALLDRTAQGLPRTLAFPATVGAARLRAAA